jgi:hypothetical protein
MVQKPLPNIDDCWLDDEIMASVSHQVPSSEEAARLLRTMWPNRIGGSLSREAYRAAAMVFASILSAFRGSSAREAERIVDEIDRTLGWSRTLPPQTDPAGTAKTTVASARDVAHSGSAPAAIAAAYEAGLLYSARMFVGAR